MNVVSRLVLFCVFIGVQSCLAAEPTRDEVLAAMRPYDGPVTNGVDRSSLIGKVMAGYQGWFTTDGDGAELGWHHYTRRGQFRPGMCNIELWPDMSELSPSEKFATRMP